MEKKLRADRNRKNLKSLKLHRETLRQLEVIEMPHVVGGWSGTSICHMTSQQCCQKV